MSFISVRGLSKRYGGLLALDEVSFKIERGEWVAVMGPSGSGKTTLINMLGCLDLPTAGEVVIAGQDVTQLSATGRAVFRREQVGLVFQQFHLVPYLTALENVMLAQYLHSMADREEARRALQEVGLGDRICHLPGQLSGGEQQRVCVARALINHPKLLLADEPTGNLDEENEKQVLAYLTRLHNAGHTIVMVTHDPDVARLANRRFELQHGKLLGVTRSTREEEEMYDEILQQVWEQGEAGIGEDCSDNPPLLENKSVLQAMVERGLLLLEAGKIALTNAGRARARDLVRRHRLAERLFLDKIHMRKEDIEPNACVFEHVLSAEVTESICRLLDHPRECPHGKPIPAGTCCEPKEKFRIVANE